MATPAANAQAGGGEDPHQAALGLVGPMQPILAGFNHRNRNQHRGARWWGSFGMLRRHLDKLAGELEASGGRSGRKRKRKRDDGESGDDPEDGPAETRARWVRDVLVPGCYVAFSQLAADNQFATLGVVLLGVLAQVNSACVGLVGERVETHDQSTPTEPTVSEENRLRPLGGAVEDAVDRGQIVSREEVARSGKVHGTMQGPRAKRKTKEAGDVPLNQKEEQGDVVPREDRAMIGKEKPTKEKKKKKKKGKSGDEFDDLFSSLF